MTCTSKFPTNFQDSDYHCIENLCFIASYTEKEVVCCSEWLASDALDLPAQVLDVASEGAIPTAAANRRTVNRSINLPDRVSETGYLQSSAGDDIFSDMLEGITTLSALI